MRIVSSLVMGVAAIAAAYLGGTWFLLFWAIAALWVWTEWVGVVAVQPRMGVLPVGAVAVFGMAAALYYDAAAIAAVVAIIGAGVAAAAASEKRAWAGAGVLYASLVLVPAVILRHDPNFGLLAIAWLFAAVWSADIAAYFAGRAIGGPLLAPRVSPKKTWSGALGGLAGGVFVSTLVAFAGGVPVKFGLIAAAVLVVIASQAGDLVESSVKRHFGVKDAGQVIPGHGGMMDRLDGFLVAAFAALIIGVARSAGSPATGLLVW